ncbi:MAG: RNA polymerase sigma factor [Salibacteraceae bacterium]
MGWLKKEKALPLGLEQVLEEHQGILQKVAFLYRDTAEDRKDLVQEMTYQVCRSFPRFRQESQVSTWMYRIALNTAMSSLRKKRPGTVPLQAEQLTISDQEDTEKKERMLQLQQAISQLNDADKSVIMLFLEDMPYREIGEILGLSENGVGVRIHRIKNRLKQLMHGAE